MVIRDVQAATTTNGTHPSDTPLLDGGESRTLITPKLISSEVICETGIIDMACDTLLLPPLFTQEYKYYKLTNRGKSRSAVFVVGQTRDSKQIIVNLEYRHPTEREFVYGFPGGLIDQGETVEQAAQRELLEETGYSAPIENFRRIGSSFPLPAISGLQTFIVAAWNLEKVSEQCLEPSETLKIVLMTVSEIDHLLMTQMQVEESCEKQRELPPRALSVDGNFVTAFWYFQKFYGAIPGQHNDHRTS